MKKLFTALLISCGLIGLITGIATEGVLWLVIAISLAIIFIALPLNMVACNTTRFLIGESKVEPDGSGQ